jgi:multidrug efflux pump subunit AcrB
MSSETPSPHLDSDDSIKALSPMTRLVGLLLRGDVALMLTALSLIAGLAALWLTPREEEPQIVVPMADILIEAPGISAAEVERQVTEKLEKLVSQIDGVEYVYSASRFGQSVVTVRFYVGEDREDSLIKLQSKIQSAVNELPPAITSWVVQPVEVDDVPIVTVSLWSQRSENGDYELRRIAEELHRELQGVPNTSRISIIGGRRRLLQVQLDPIKMAAHRTSMEQVGTALRESNVQWRAGSFDQQNRQMLIETGDRLRQRSDLQNLVVGVYGNQPIYLSNVAEIIDGPETPWNYSWMGFGAANDQSEATTDVYPAVHLAIAKKKGANAVEVAHRLEQRMTQIQPLYLPEGVHYRVTRDYGETANEKVSELIEGLAVAILTVVVLIGMVIGWRAALVVAIAIPVCYSITLLVNLLVGYSINRVTMFALILSLGLLVDDPITDVENIARYFTTKRLAPRLSVLYAIQEVRAALIMSTLAIIISFLPLAFITGMMGPYMAPMALNVPLTVTISTFVAFTITPWLAMIALQKSVRSSNDPLEPTDSEPSTDASWVHSSSKLFFGLVLRSPQRAAGVLAAVVLVMGLVSAIPLFRGIPLKILPYDNKNEFQVIVDLPEGTTLERTDIVARRVGRFLGGLSEVRDYQVFVGNASPMDFNGLVRHYFQRRGSSVADIRVNLIAKEQRLHQSHEIILRIRESIAAMGRELGANLKIVEVPPGPPVLATITAEVYGPPDSSYPGLQRVAGIVEQRLAAEPGIVDVDSTLEAEQTLFRFVVDKPKTALSGISTRQIAEALQAGVAGQLVTAIDSSGEVEPLQVELRLPRINRSSLTELQQVYFPTRDGKMIQLGALGQFIETVNDATIYRKNLRRVAYVYGEIAGVPPANVIVDIMLDQVDPKTKLPPAIPPRPLAERTWLNPGGGQPWSIPEGFEVSWTGEGELKITLDVFRDLGIAFLAALVGIYFLLMFQTGSRWLPLLIMSAIPLSLIGILPGFWALNWWNREPIGGHPNPTFFTATAMIGVIALAGIVVRNSIVLIDFMDIARAEGQDMFDAVVNSVAVRMRPILLTAGTTLLGNWVITFDPVFSGLAWAIIFGIFASTLFTLIVIPVSYWMLNSSRD